MPLQISSRLCVVHSARYLGQIDAEQLGYLRRRLVRLEASTATLTFRLGGCFANRYRAGAVTVTLTS